MKFRLLAVIAFASVLYSCDDSTTGIGDFVSGIDKIEAFSDKYEATSRTVLKDTIYAHTNKAYLGKYTDSDFGLFSADFITQINCPENFEFPEGKDLEIESTELELRYTSFYGDSLANLTLQVDTLNKVIGEEDGKLYYTSYEPKEYYDESKHYLARKTFAVADHSLSDSVRNVNQYYYHSIDLGKDFSDYLFDKYNKDKSYFKDSYNFIRNVLKGFYIHVINGEGSVIYIDDISMKMKVKYLTKRPSTGEVDSLVYAVTSFSASKEVLTSTRMEHSDKLAELVDEEGHTYLKTPAGLCTEITLPIDEMYEAHQNDTLNSVTMSVKKFRYAGESENQSQYVIGVPQNLLMVRVDDYKDFFEKNKIYDDKTSFLATYNSSTNSYTFSKLNRLISHIFSEKREGKVSENWNKVLLVPVTTDVDTQNNNSVIGISNDLSVSAARLFGGTNGEKLEMEITYTKP